MMARTLRTIKPRKWVGVFLLILVALVVDTIHTIKMRGEIETLRRELKKQIREEVVEEVEAELGVVNGI